MPNTVEIERGTLTEWMEARNISVRQLAARAGVTTQAVYRWRHGDCRPIELRTVYRVLGVEEGQVLWGTKGGETLAENS